RARPRRPQAPRRRARPGQGGVQRSRREPGQRGGRLMDLATKVSQLPGRGGDLAGILRSVDGDPAAIRAIAKRWRSAADKVSEQTGRVSTAVAGVDTAWQGVSADAFDDYMSAYGKAGGALHDALYDSASTLDTAAGTLETARSRI